MANSIEAWQWVEVADIAWDEVQHLAFYYLPANWDPYGRVYVANAWRLNVRDPEGNAEYGGEVEITNMYWQTVGDGEGYPTGTRMIHFHIDPHGQTGRYSLWVAQIPAHAG